MSYFQDRVHKEMKLQKDDYTLELKMSDPFHGHQITKKIEFLRENKFGDIEIMPYTLDRHIIEYDHKDSRNTFTDKGENLDIYTVNRLHPDRVKGSRKYHIPGGQQTQPFFPPYLLRLYEQKKKIKTLILTEGYLKAIVGGKHKIPVVGLSSITTYQTREKQIYPEILKIIKACNVENVMMLYDGDYGDLHKNAVENHEELTKRPNNSFFASAKNMQRLYVSKEIDFYFAHIKSELIEGKPKGLDDLLLSVDEKTADKITLKATKLFSDKEFFYKQNVTGSISKLKKYFGLNSVNSFFKKYQSQISLNKFFFFGTEYEFDFEKDKLRIVMPEAANRYIRVGDDYYEKLTRPTTKETHLKLLVRRLKSTIKDDHGPKIFKYIDKFKDFINMPSHEDYQAIVDGFYNMYSDFTHEPKEGTWDNTKMYMQHVFGDQYEMGLDYVQLLFQRPTQILPILSLVSSENSTGKTMFAKWLGEIFKGNSAIIGNSEIASDFNGHLQGKLIIAIDESFIEKKLIVEKIKSLATATELPMTKKGKDTIFVDFFGKIILLSNNVDTFITASEDDVRYWVRELKKPEKENPNLLTDLINEIPAFLYYLQKRKISTENTTRAWFAYDLLKTDALKKVIDKSRPYVYRIIHHEITEMFENHTVYRIQMSISDIKEQFFKNNHRVETPYIKEILTDYFKMKKSEKPGRYKFPNGMLNDVINFYEGNSTFYTFEAKDFLPEHKIFAKPDDDNNDLPF